MNEVQVDLVVTTFSHVCSLLFAQCSFVAWSTCSLQYKFGWVKLQWRIAPDLLISPKLSPATVLCYTIIIYTTQLILGMHLGINSVHKTLNCCILPCAVSLYCTDLLYHSHFIFSTELFQRLQLLQLRLFY